MKTVEKLIEDLEAIVIDLKCNSWGNRTKDNESRIKTLASEAIRKLESIQAGVSIETKSCAQALIKKT